MRPVLGPLTYKEWLIERAMISMRNRHLNDFAENGWADGLLWTDYCSQGRYREFMTPIRVDWPQISGTPWAPLGLKGSEDWIEVD